MENKIEDAAGSVVIEKRNKAVVTSVEKVASVKDDGIILVTDLGNLSFYGKNFTISGFNEKDRVFTFTGDIDGCSYSVKKEPLLKKLFK